MSLRQPIKTSESRDNEEKSSKTWDAEGESKDREIGTMSTRTRRGESGVMDNLRRFSPEALRPHRLGLPGTGDQFRDKWKE
jgi:hypothetical protein